MAHASSTECGDGASGHVDEEPTREFDCSGNAGIVPSAMAAVGCTGVTEGKISAGSSGAGCGSRAAAKRWVVGADGPRTLRGWSQGHHPPHLLTS
jgi:hypothetical protein